MWFETRSVIRSVGVTLLKSLVACRNGLLNIEDKCKQVKYPVGNDAKSGERLTNVDTLRDELLNQFESINIIEPDSYELNLAKLYEREVHIIQIQEDGKYVIQIPER